MLLTPSSASITVHDLPQLYTRPTFEILLETLNLLELKPTAFSHHHLYPPPPLPSSSSASSSDSTTQAVCSSLSSSSLASQSHYPTITPTSRIKRQPTVEASGVPRYLTGVVSSSLGWLSTDAQRETIWELASTRLSERSGRTAMPSITRRFAVADNVTVELFEPSLTEDNLGLKTWTSSFLLARRLERLRHRVPALHHESGEGPRVLELGSGTGLVGIAAAAVWSRLPITTSTVDASRNDNDDDDDDDDDDDNDHPRPRRAVKLVTLTDLPAIIPNLQRNVDANRRLFPGDLTVSVRALDWSQPLDGSEGDSHHYDIILAADPIYSAHHPRLLVDTVDMYLAPHGDARFVVELPLREAYGGEREELRRRIGEKGMELVEQGTEVGFDDWVGVDGESVEVECWWSVWKRRERNEELGE